ncbi:LOW QUALITY PROTEIN: putative leucine-rich repeat receptor-like serine/threonine-protein kinase At2g24130 [Actinidia eriantha]|uniref:LOW QUALITY PROTEIN: putative leucine-rich repeat receptor-like serine/threonine-protein kinase At2g24130 n=1 Tax=Actinidia eriantha TaxID=165200 RepID=UPI00258426CC|nr:LOW QUALITY PROTEIN: putative leucine-rich repeat receptor-like serine/threonine-protein kinase At2g24130 [Actinidia eriantha]
MWHHEHRGERHRKGASNYSNMVFKRTMFLYLLQYLVITSGRSLTAHQQHHHRSHDSLETDRAALLDFKRTISSDPNSSLANWNRTTHVCKFSGVRCNKQHHRVTQIVIHDAGLVGLLSPVISNLTRLRVLDLVNNRLFGTIPWELSSLRHLRRVWLEGNHLQGQIPDSFSLLASLVVVNLRANELTGIIPASLFSNCTFLRNVDLSANFLEGKIPPEIGNCQGLWNLNLYNNKFTGEIPFSITNASSMYNLDVEYNHLSGELPTEIVGNLPGFRYLHLSYSGMVGSNLDPFFTALGNCTFLEELELAGMKLQGRLPSSIGQLVASLATLMLQENRITGSIPPSLSNITSLVWLNLTSNLLSGTIPEGISQLSLLEQLFLSHNFLCGQIPAALGQFQGLGLLDLSHNRFSGEIPKSLGNLKKINFMFLNHNLLSGAIPASLGYCTDLFKLDLSYNRLNGTIPPEISGLREIRMFLNLSHNHLEGPFPIELSKLENVQEVDLSSNNLTGSVFPQISNCIALRLINISHNFLQGQLPESLGELKNLEAFDVSVNQLSGNIPANLNKLLTLTFLNLSFNDFSGMIPSGGVFDSLTILSFLDNQGLCGSVSGIPNCHRKKNPFRSHAFLIAFCIVASILMALLIICCVIGCRYLKVIISAGNVETERKSQPELIQNFPRITYKELSDATGGFDQQRLLGSGSYGHVYKGVLPDGTPIAVKVLHLQTGNSTKSFNRECQVLKRIRHRNLIRIITACSLPDFKALVLPYMANGSLDGRLYPHSGNGLGSSGSSDLSLIQRVNICSDIAEGMAYLHHHSPVRVIHCDLKPSNVLLNDDMTALVSDFGIARLVMTVAGGNAGVVENMGNSTANVLSGSIGYIAPEYGFGSNTNTKGDVYSFGILVLEMVTRKRPTDDMFVGALSLHRWVKSHYHGRVERVIDSSLVRAMKDQSPEVKKMWEVAIGELMELGMLCTQDSPNTRPTMLDAADDLDRLKRYLTGDSTATFASSLGISSSTIGDD